MTNWPYLLGAYTVAWLGITCFVFSTIKRQRLVEKTLAELEARQHKKK